MGNGNVFRALENHLLIFESRKKISGKGSLDSFTALLIFLAFAHGLRRVQDGANRLPSEEFMQLEVTMPRSASRVVVQTQFGAGVVRARHAGAGWSVVPACPENRSPQKTKTKKITRMTKGVET